MNEKKKNNIIAVALFQVNFVILNNRTTEPNGTGNIVKRQTQQ